MAERQEDDGFMFDSPFEDVECENGLRVHILRHHRRPPMTEEEADKLIAEVTKRREAARAVALAAKQAKQTSKDAPAVPTNAGNAASP
jgi:hypothetical protein